MNTITQSYKAAKLQVKNKIDNLNVNYFLFFSFLFSQVKDTTQVNKLDEVLVSAVRVTTQTPVSFSNWIKRKSNLEI
jgi:iron complex outermembrane receptor protein